MNIFQIKTQPHGIERKELFIEEEFVCIGYPDIGDLTNIDKDELRERLKNEYGWQSSQLGNHLGVVNTFINIMEAGDIVLVSDNDWVHIGELGEYEYESQYEAEGMCHRRYVHWLDKVERFKLNEYVKELLRNRSIVTKFKHPYDIAELELVLGQNYSVKATVNIGEDAASKAIDILTTALDSQNEEIRVRAAIGILNYLK